MKRQSPCQSRLLAFVGNAMLLLSPRQSRALSSATVPSRSHLFPASTIRHVMAPMVAASDYPYRCLLRQHGVDLCCTQMLHAKNLVRDAQFRRCHLDLQEYRGIPSWEGLIGPQRRFLGDSALREVPHSLRSFVRGPLVVQLAGSTVDSVVAAAALVMHEAPHLTGIDLNLGCPQGIARKGNYGAFLCERDFAGVCEILSALSLYMDRNHPQTMVSAKIRLPLCDQILQEQRIPRLIDTGISFLTIHGRTLYENKSRAGECHLDRIRLAVETAHQIRPDFPIIANGGVESYPDVLTVRRETNAVAVMSSEALLETPDLFRSDFAERRTTARQRFTQQIGFAHDYLDWCQICPPLPGVLGVHGSFQICRSHLFKFLHRYLQEQPILRDRLGGPGPATVQDARDIVDELERKYTCMSDPELERCGSTQPKSSWYRRHWESMGIVHTRQVGGATSPVNQVSLSVEEKKEILRKRIAQLKDQKLMRTGG